MNIFLFYNPAITLSVAFSNFYRVTYSICYRADKIAASLQVLANSAPLKPGVNLAILEANSSSVSWGSYFTFFKWTFKIYARSSKFGRPIYTDLSNLPGLRRAGSSISFLLVAAMTITLFLVSNPSILTNNWFKVLSLSSFEKGPPSLFLPIASISSIKMMLGAFFSASSNRFLTLEAPKPEYFSTKSLPETEKKGTPAYPAHALASKVLPVPGGPHNNR